MTEAIQFLFPTDPINALAVDVTDADEYRAFKSAGYLVSVFSFEDFEAGQFRAKSVLISGETLVYIADGC